METTVPPCIESRLLPIDRVGIKR
ncbi:protein of unknown function (plasmid) [Azospirillum baldaniorum]|uniref:Uncharacterized protein n=1 Tax=Azospirillum baldaniorum TaxID=1064539 RepID=A0A9P1NQJ2_9PROT|nr:protein of unknown function [Azospirillum baldaniorum]